MVLEGQAGREAAATGARHHWLAAPGCPVAFSKTMIARLCSGGGSNPAKRGHSILSSRAAQRIHPGVRGFGSDAATRDVFTLAAVARRRTASPIVRKTK